MPLIAVEISLSQRVQVWTPLVVNKHDCYHSLFRWEKHHTVLAIWGFSSLSSLFHLLRSQKFTVLLEVKMCISAGILLLSIAFAAIKIVSIFKLKCGLELRVCFVQKKPRGTCVRSSWVGGITWGYTLYGG